MKTFKLVGMAILAIFMSLSLAACSDDDDNPGGGTSASIVGEWQQTWSKGYEKYYDYPEDNSEWNTAASTYQIKFNQDGTGVQYGTEDNTTYQYDFTWKQNGNKLSVIMTEEGYVEKSEVKIAELTANTLKLEQASKDEEGSYYSLDTFKKIK